MAQYGRLNLNNATPRICGRYNWTLHESLSNYLIGKRGGRPMPKNLSVSRWYKRSNVSQLAPRVHYPPGNAIMNEHFATRWSPTKSFDTYLEDNR